MRTVTVANILAKQVDSALGHLIYVVRDQSLVFYVGQSKRDVVKRFWEHLHKPSRLGRLIDANRPDSLNWSVDFYTLADCQPFVTQKTLFPMQEWQHFDMDMAEIAMIQELRPVLNHDFNPHPTPLPAHYRGQAFTETPAMPEQATSPRWRPWLNRMSLNGWVYVRDPENGRIWWRHHSGVVLADEEVAPYRQANQLPPTTG